MTNSTSSKNYAKALAEIAQDKVMSYDDIKRDLDITESILESSNELKSILENTTISNTIKTDIVNEVFKNQKGNFSRQRTRYNIFCILPSKDFTLI